MITEKKLKCLGFRTLQEIQEPEKNESSQVGCGRGSGYLVIKYQWKRTTKMGNNIIITVMNGSV